MRVLIIEDEASLAKSMSEGLVLDGYDVEVATDGEEGLDKLFDENYDIVLLDLNLPKMDGMDVLEEFRKENLDTPVLILSARISIEDKIQGLDMGANDYLTKPFHFEELEARIRSLTRRRFVQENTVLKLGDLKYDTKKKIATVEGRAEELMLTKKESGILEYLMLHQDQVISQEDLITHVWDTNVDEFTGSVRVHISSLRKKLRSALGYDPIVNKVGQGYIISQGRE